MTTRPVVVVLGMHRAGTSLTTRMLEIIGVRLGDDLIAGRDDNPRGFFEHAGLVQHVKAIEQLINRPPFRPQGLLPFPEGWLEIEGVDAERQALTDLLAGELDSAAPHVFGFKDPLRARFLPLWQQIFETLDCAPLYVLATRDAKATVRSNMVRTKMTQAEAELIWMLHYADAYRHTNGKFAAVVSFERWFSEPEAQANEIATALNLADAFDTGRFMEAAKDWIDPNLNHSRRPDEDDLELSAIVARFETALEACLVDAAEAEQCRTMTTAFMEWRSLLSPWALGCEGQEALLSRIVDANRTVGRHNRRILESQDTVKALKKELERSRTELDDLRTTSDQQIRKLTNRVADLSLSKAALDDLQSLTYWRLGAKLGLVPANRSTRRTTGKKAGA